MEKILADDAPVKLHKDITHMSNGIEDCLELMAFKELPVVADLIKY